MRSDLLALCAVLTMSIPVAAQEPASSAASRPVSVPSAANGKAGDAMALSSAPVAPKIFACLLPAWNAAQTLALAQEPGNPPTIEHAFRGDFCGSAGQQQEGFRSPQYCDAFFFCAQIITVCQMNPRTGEFQPLDIGMCPLCGVIAAGQPKGAR